MAERTVSRVTLLNEAGPTSQHKASFFRKKNPLNRRLGAMAPAPPLTGYAPAQVQSSGVFCLLHSIKE